MSDKKKGEVRRRVARVLRGRRHFIARFAVEPGAHSQEIGLPLRSRFWPYPCERFAGGPSNIRLAPFREPLLRTPRESDVTRSSRILSGAETLGEVCAKVHRYFSENAAVFAVMFENSLASVEVAPILADSGHWPWQDQFRAGAGNACCGRRGFFALACKPRLSQSCLWKRIELRENESALRSEKKNPPRISARRASGGPRNYAAVGKWTRKSAAIFSGTHASIRIMPPDSVCEKLNELLLHNGRSGSLVLQPTAAARTHQRVRSRTFRIR
jgi:hypothetical protein